MTDQVEDLIYFLLGTLLDDTLGSHCGHGWPTNECVRTKSWQQYRDGFLVYRMSALKVQEHRLSLRGSDPNPGTRNGSVPSLFATADVQVGSWPTQQVSAEPIDLPGLARDETSRERVWHVGSVDGVSTGTRRRHIHVLHAVVAQWQVGATIALGSSFCVVVHPTCPTAASLHLNGARWRIGTRTSRVSCLPVLSEQSNHQPKEAMVRGKCLGILVLTVVMASGASGRSDITPASHPGVQLSFVGFCL